MFHRWLNSLILQPDRLCYQVPTDVGLQAETVTFPNTQGQILHGLWVQPGQTPGGTDTPAGPVVLFCPGTAGNLSSHLYYIEALCRAGCTVLGFDYTGFGASAGQASLHTLLPDIFCAAQWLTQTQGVQRWGLFGVSLGANLALVAATQRADVGAVAMEGLASYEGIARGILQDGVMGPRSVTSILYDGQLQPSRPYHVVNSWTVGPWLARHLTRVGVRTFPFPGKMPHSSARLLTATPALFIHGIDDPLLPFEGTLQVYDATPGPKRLWLMPHVGHAQEPILAQDGEYVAQLHDFFSATLGPPAPQGLPSIHCQVTAQKAPTVELYNPGPACLTLLTTGTQDSLASQTLWLPAQARQQHQVPVATPCLASALRLFASTACGATAAAQLTSRGQRYQAEFRPLMRQVARLVHERRIGELEPVMHDFPQQRPEAPFDFFLGLYCVQIMQRAQRQQPDLARAAAEVFCRYWHYGPQQVAAGAPSLWALASTILGRSVGPAEPGGCA